MITSNNNAIKLLVKIYNFLVFIIELWFISIEFSYLPTDNDKLLYYFIGIAPLILYFFYLIRRINLREIENIQLRLLLKFIIFDFCFIIFYTLYIIIMMLISLKPDDINMVQ